MTTSYFNCTCVLLLSSWVLLGCGGGSSSNTGTSAGGAGGHSGSTGGASTSGGTSGGMQSSSGTSTASTGGTSLPHGGSGGNANVATSQGGVSGSSGGSAATGGGSGDGGSQACPSSIDITATVQGSGSYHGSTVGNVADKSSCANQTGPKTQLYYHASATQNVRINVMSSKPSTDPTANDAAVWVRTDCSNYWSEIGCNPSAATTPTWVGIDTGNGKQALTFTGDVYITVAGAYFDAGFDLKITTVSSCFGNSDCAKYETANCNQLTGACHTVMQCPAGTADCNNDMTDGCEVNIKGSDVNHCGNCGIVCPTGEQHQTGVACAAGVCVLSCEAGWGDCTNTGAGCESNLATSSIACGACGHDCQGGLCTNSVCGPAAETVATMTRTLKTSDPSTDGWITRIEVDANNVYMQEQNTIDTVLSLAPKAGGASQIVTWNDTDFTVSGGTLWWVSNHNVSKRTSDGTISSVIDLPSTEVLKYVFYDGSTLWLLEAAVATEPVTQASVRLLPNGATATQVLWTQDAGDWFCGALSGSGLVARAYGFSSPPYPDSLFEFVPKSGTPASFGTSLGALNADAIAADAGNIYGGGCDNTVLPLGSSCGVYAQPINNADATALWTTSTSSVFAVAVNDTNVYFAEMGNDYLPPRIRRVAKTGGDATVLASDSVGPYAFTIPAIYGFSPMRLLAVDSDYVYWPNQDGVIRRVPK